MNETVSEEMVKTQTLYHVTLKKNYESIMQEGLLPKIGEMSEGLEKVPAVYLFPTYEDCETALGQWLGVELDELFPDEEAVSLKVELPINFPLIETCEWERMSLDKIPPSHISYHQFEG